MANWCFVNSFPTYQPGNRSEYIHVQGRLFEALTLRAPGTLTHHPFVFIGSFIRVLPVLTSTRVIVKVLGRVHE